MIDGIINLIHLLATAIWIGGAIYITFILEPALRLIDPQQSGRLQAVIAKRFSVTAWACIIILIITGYLKTPQGLLFDFSSAIGRVLLIKHILIAGAIIVGLTIALHIVPNIRKHAPKQGEAPSSDFIKFQKRLFIFATMNLALGLLVVVCASQLR